MALLHDVPHHREHRRRPTSPTRSRSRSASSRSSLVAWIAVRIATALVNRFVKHTIGGVERIAAIGSGISFVDTQPMSDVRRVQRAQHDRRGVAQRRVDPDLVDRGAHHPRGAGREPRAAARGRGHRGHRVGLRRAVAREGLRHRAVHAARRPVRCGRRHRHRCRDRHGRGRRAAHHAAPRRRRCGVARAQRRDRPRGEQVAAVVARARRRRGRVRSRRRRPRPT